MIEVSIFNDEVSKNLDEALSLLSSWGQEWLDLRESIFGQTVIDEISDSEREVLVEKLSKYSFKIGCLGTRKLVVTPGDAGEEFSVIPKLIKTAEAFKVPFIRVCTEKRPESDMELRMKMVKASVDNMKRLSDIAAKHGITLVLENKPSSLTNRGVEMAEFLAMVDHPNLKLVWDAVNSWQGGLYDPDGDYQACKKYIGIVHLKGAMGKADKQDVYERGGIIGEDEFPHDRIVKTLIKDGYDGRITLDLAIGAIKGKERRLERADISKLSLERMKDIIAKAYGK